MRVTYPIKRIIKSMDDCRAINMDCPITKYCVSSVLCRLCEVGMCRMVRAWNNHPIPNRGIPNEIQLQAYNTALIHAEIPLPPDAVLQYRSQGGQLRDPGAFGTDPLEGDSDLYIERDEQWLTKCRMDIEQMFSEIISLYWKMLYWILLISPRFCPQQFRLHAITVFAVFEL